MKLRFTTNGEVGHICQPKPATHNTDSSLAIFQNIKHLVPRMKRTVEAMKWIEADKQLAIDLNIPEGSSIFHFLRIDQINSKPMALDKGWIFGQFAHKLRKSDLTHIDFFEHWQETQSFSATKSLMELQAVAANKSQAEILNIRKGCPLLVETSYIFAGDQGAARFTTWYRHDIYKFKNTIHFFNHKDKEND